MKKINKLKMMVDNAPPGGVQTEEVWDEEDVVLSPDVLRGKLGGNNISEQDSATLNFGSAGSQAHFIYDSLNKMYTASFKVSSYQRYRITPQRWARPSAIFDDVYPGEDGQITITFEGIMTRAEEFIVQGPTNVVIDITNFKIEEGAVSTPWSPNWNKALPVKNIPDIPAGKITSGALADARIPGLATTKITSGTFADARIPNLAASKITSGTFTDARIPNLDASKITSGIFADERIPSLDASKTTTGTFAAARIPSLTATKITSGTFNSARIPSLDASKITSGVFDAQRIPPVLTQSVLDTRTANNTPAWYYTNYPKQVVYEFKRFDALGITEGSYGTHCVVETLVPWHDDSGGGVVQRANSLGNRTGWYRRGTGASWGAWLIIH